jgi:hypothetical protein
VTGSSHIARIPSARWFRHALSLNDMLVLLQSRARALECARDGRAPFVRLRLSQLRSVYDRLEAGAFGRGAAWVERLELEHVHQYLRSDDAWDRGEHGLTAAPWRAIFSHLRCGADPAQVLRTAGVVHLIYDLPLAISRTGLGTLSESEAVLTFNDLTELYARPTSDSVRVIIRDTRADARTNHDEPSGLPRGLHGTSWQRALREQAWDDALALGSGGERERRVAFTRIELAAMCEVRDSLT